MDEALSILLSQAIKGMSVREASERCELPAHRLRDIIYMKVQRPDRDVLLAIEKGLGIPYPKLALAAYGWVADVSYNPADAGSEASSLSIGSPAEVNNGTGEWRRTGNKPQRVSAST